MTQDKDKSGFPPRVWVKIKQWGRWETPRACILLRPSKQHPNEYLSLKEHDHTLSKEQRLNAMGQERELALMARVADLEKRLLVAKEALGKYAGYMDGDNPEFTKSGWQKYPSPNAAKEALAAIEKEGR